MSAEGDGTNPTPAAGAEREEPDRALEAALETPFARTVFEASGTAMVVVDEARRVIAANGLARAAVRLAPGQQIAGRRLGELLGCAQSGVSPLGCGESSSCQPCGALKALEASLRSGLRAEEECLMTRSCDGALDAAELRVVATPLDLGGRRLVLVALRDVSGEKRRRTLERIFVHDLNNIVATLYAWVDLLDDPDPGIRADAVARVQRLTRKVVEEMRSHSLLTLVESSEFVPSWQPRTPAEVLESAAAAAAPGEDGAPVIELARPIPVEPFTTDLALLTRVLDNMLRNAIDAAPEGPIRLGCERSARGYRFTVGNPGEIPAAIAARIFRRSFSTKASRGRGLGTYSMKLFGERILGGAVGFTTGPDGTVFYIDHPLQRPDGKGAGR